MLDWKRDLDTLIGLASNVVDAFSATFFLLDTNKKRLNLVSFHTLSRHFIEDVSIELGSGLIGRVALLGDPVNVSEFQLDVKALQYYGDEKDIKAFMAVPVFPKDPVGVLAVDSKREYSFTPKMQKILAGFAEQFHRTASYYGLLRQTQFREVRGLLPLMDINRKLCSGLETSEILDLLGFTHREIVHCDGAAVMLRAEGETHRVARAWGDASPVEGSRMTPHQGLVGWVIRNATSLNLHNLKGYGRKTFVFSPSEPELRVRSFLGVPLAFRGEVLGVLAFLGREPNIFSDYHVQMASLIAGQASLALLQAQMQLDWKSLAHRDAVTGLWNHRSFQEMLEELPNRHAGKTRPYLVMVEPDKSARLKALRGSAAHDEVIRRIARILQGVVDRRDHIARSMDEGFLVFLDPRDQRAAEQFVERAKRAIEEAVFLLEKGGMQVSVSVGLFPFAEGKEEGTDLVAKAWAAFQSAKKAGVSRIWNFG